MRLFLAIALPPEDRSRHPRPGTADDPDRTAGTGNLRRRDLIRVCKRAAVKAGQNLSLDEQKALLRDLEACQAPRTCPHGRPPMIHLSVDMLERQFGRKGPR